MSDPISTLAPGGFVPRQAVAFADAAGFAVPVGMATPLPVATLIAPAASTALTGTATTSLVAGPFTPELGRAIWLTLSGTWSGNVALERSTDGGATRLPLTVGGQSWATFAANANEPIGEETVSGATYYLSVTLTSGTLSYQVAQ